jgi:type II secretory pathway component GspD/PulD (secretin)
MKFRIYLTTATLLFAIITATAAELVFIDLRNRTAEELLPILRPMAGSASLSGADYKLFVRGEPADVARIREMLAVLDKAPQQLMVSVRYSTSAQKNHTDIRGAGTISNQGSNVALSGKAVRSTADDGTTASVRVLEGNGAHISTGQSVPVVSSFLVASRNGKGGTTGFATDYRELSTGFNVVPRVNGDRVVLEISAQQQNLSGNGAGSASTQRTTTTLAGKIGEWIELGGVDDSFDEQRSGVGIAGGSQRTATRSDRRAIAVKVEKAE